MANYIKDANECIKPQMCKKKNGAGLALLQPIPLRYLQTIKDLPTASAAFRVLETKYLKQGGQ